MVEYIPIGVQCTTARALQEIGKRKRSYPFDWVLISLNEVCRVLEELSEMKFNMFDEMSECYVEERDTHRFVKEKTGNEKYNCVEKYKTVLPHDENTEDSKEKYIRRFKRLYDVLKDGEKQIVLLLVNSSNIHNRYTYEREEQSYIKDEELCKLDEIMRRYREDKYMIEILDTGFSKTSKRYERIKIKQIGNYCNWVSMIPKVKEEIQRLHNTKYIYERGDEYDIVYSVLVHENVESFKMMIENVGKASEGYKWAIIVNGTAEIQEDLYKLQEEYDNLYVNGAPRPRVHATLDILKGHVLNIDSMNKVKYKKMMLLASNCMAFRKINLEEIEKGKYKKTYEEVKHERWTHWAEFAENKELMEELKNKGIPLVLIYHEGGIYSKEEIKDIVRLCKSYSKLLINTNTCFEEILLPSLEHYITGNQVMRYCYCDFEKEITNEQIETLKKTHYYFVKRIPRKIDDPMRKLLTNEEFT